MNYFIYNNSNALLQWKMNGKIRYKRIYHLQILHLLQKSTNSKLIYIYYRLIFRGIFNLKVRLIFKLKRKKK